MNRQKIRKSLALASFLLFPITLYFFSPYLAVEGAFMGIVVGSVMVFTAQFILSLFLGRIFCGWLCPGSGIQECCQIAVDKKAKTGQRDLIKYIIWVPWIAVIGAGFFIKGVKKFDFLFHTYNGISVAEAEGYVVYSMVIALMVIPALAIGKRSFCHYICWVAPFMIIGKKVKNYFNWPGLRLVVDSSKCVNCKSCNKKCQMSLDVNAMVQRGSMENPECILCGECVDACPKRAMRYSFL